VSPLVATVVTATVGATAAITLQFVATAVWVETRVGLFSQRGITVAVAAILLVSTTVAAAAAGVVARRAFTPAAVVRARAAALAGAVFPTVLNGVQLAAGGPVLGGTSGMLAGTAAAVLVVWAVVRPRGRERW
jgi:hypothetical protein